jgi:hypothetical protein
VIGVAAKHLKVLWAVVSGIVVFVMHHFPRQQRAAQGKLANQPMLPQVAIAVARRMIRPVDENIP